MNQTTISNEVSVVGVGLHTGVEVNLRLKPAPENTGYVFVRTERGGNPANLAGF